MKKTLLLLILSITFSCIHAQQIDTTLLYGRWDLYYALSQGNALYRDSLTQFIDAVVQSRKGAKPGAQLSAADSGMVQYLKDRTADIFSSYFIFDEKGKSQEQICVSGVCRIDTGTYQWIAKDQIVQKKQGGLESVILTVHSLTSSRLEVRLDDGDPSNVTELIYTRAKGKQ